MADQRVHPADLPPAAPPPPPESETETEPLHPQYYGRSTPPPAGTYIIKVPKDQILREPPPENARRSKKLAARPKRRRCLRRCCVYTCCGAIALAVLLAAFVAVLLLVCKPRLPEYSVESVSVAGLEASVIAGAGDAVVSPRITAAVRADNSKNGKVGIYYLDGNSVSTSFNGVVLGSGEWPAMFQPAGNVTVITATMKGENVKIAAGDKEALLRAEASHSVPLAVDVSAPVKVKLWFLTTWRITVKEKCEVKVDLTAAAANATVVGGTSCAATVLYFWWER